MTPQVDALLKHADEKLRAARVLLDAEAPGDAASRAYYAAFHAVTAALLSIGESYSSHGQMLGAFNRRFVHTGLVPKDFTTLLNRLFEDRQTGDYDLAIGVSHDEAQQDLEHAAVIVATIRRHLAQTNA